MKIPFLSFEPINKIIRTEIMSSFEAFFDSSWYVLGEKVKVFEDEYASFNNVSHAIGISNGLDALHIALKSLNISEGDEVIVPSNTFIATALAVSYVGATPKFVEPNIRTYNIDPINIENAITNKTKAIMPVHLYGQACEMEAIMEIAKKYGLFVVEDNAQAQGATYSGKMTSSFGDINATSFYPGKNLGAFGDAGALTTNNNELSNKAKSLRNYGSDKKYHNDIIGFNMRLDECQASFLSTKLKYLKSWTQQRQEIASWYNSSLYNVGQIVLPVIAEKSTHVYHLYVIRSKERENLQSFLASKGVSTLIHYPIPIHLQQAYAHLGYKKGVFPIAEEIANTCLSLPIWPGMLREEVEYVSSCIKEFYQI